VKFWVAGERVIGLLGVHGHVVPLAGEAAAKLTDPDVLTGLASRGECGGVSVLGYECDLHDRASLAACHHGEPPGPGG
jgi:hypothetical protein